MAAWHGGQAFSCCTDKNQLYKECGIARSDGHPPRVWHHTCEHHTPAQEASFKEETSNELQCPTQLSVCVLYATVGLRISEVPAIRWCCLENLQVRVAKNSVRA